MRIETVVPDALHLCPGCESVAAGELYCETCRHVAEFYDKLLTKTGYRAVGETQAIEDEGPAADCCGLIRGVVFGFLMEAWALAMGFGVHYIWTHWK
jgi:hypothetical protein